MINKNYLPYFKINEKNDYYALYRFLRRKFRPSLKNKFPYHYLILQDPRFYLKFIRQVSKNHPYFLRFDINKYFPSINHSILLSEIKSNYQQLTMKAVSRRFKYILKKDLPQFLQSSPYNNQGLAIGSPLSYFLAGIYLLKLDLNLSVPFLRFTDDYLIFCKTREQTDLLLKNTISPILNKLELSINIQKLSSGKFHQDKVNFLGFEFYAGYIRISQEKIERFKQNIKKFTYLTRKKSTTAIIKQLNNQILGFGHYYKLAQAKQIFEELDSFIRSRLRRYIGRNKEVNSKQNNLTITNELLKQLRLKSLIKIYEKYTSKKSGKSKKLKKTKNKTGLKQSFYSSELTEFSVQYRQKQILTKIEELTTFIYKLKKIIINMERKITDKKD